MEIVYKLNKKFRTYGVRLDIYVSSRCVPQYEHTSFVTMATYCVPDLPDIKGFAGHLYYSVLIFANFNEASSA